MKRNKCRLICILLLGVLLFSTPFKVNAKDNNTDDNNVIENELDWCIENFESDSEWYIMSLSRYGSSYEYDRYIKELDNKVKNRLQEYNKVSALRLGMAYTVLDRDNENVKVIYEYTKEQELINGYIYRLRFLTEINQENNAYKAEIDLLINKILELKLEDGGYALSGGMSDVDITAMAVASLAPYKADERVKTAIDEAVLMLSKRQQENGGYSSFGKETSESISQVISMLCALEINPFTDSRFIKNNNTLYDALQSYKTEGGYRHTADTKANELATVQAFTALVDIWEKEYEVVVYQHKATPVANNITVNYIKNIAAVSVIAITVLAMVIFALLKKMNKNRAVMGGILILICVGAIFLKLQTNEEYYSEREEIHGEAIDVWITIDCSLIKDKNNKFVPEDGMLLRETNIKLENGASAFEALYKAAKENKLPLDYSDTTTIYVKGINHIYEFDYGDLSGWMYEVNGEEKSVGSGDYILKEGDRLVWFYTLNLGRDR